MRVVRAAATAASWVLTIVGVVALLAFGATKAGWMQPLVVTSGSMEPQIATGDLLVARPVPTSDLQPGDVATLRSTLGHLVTHRVVEVEHTDSGATVRMKGDANANADAEAYEVGPTHWQPAWQIAGAGRVVDAARSPAVLIPLATVALAVVVLSGDRKEAR